MMRSRYLPVVRAVLDQLGERLLRTPSQQFTLQNHPKHLAKTRSCSSLLVAVVDQATGLWICEAYHFVKGASQSRTVVFKEIQLDWWV